jgi:hypothetical protein
MEQTFLDQESAMSQEYQQALNDLVWITLKIKKTIIEHDDDTLNRDWLRYNKAVLSLAMNQSFIIKLLASEIEEREKELLQIRYAPVPEEPVPVLISSRAPILLRIINYAALFSLIGFTFWVIHSDSLSLTHVLRDGVIGVFLLLLSQELFLQNFIVRTSNFFRKGLVSITKLASIRF